MAVEIDDLLNTIRWNEDYLRYNYDIGFLLEGMSKPTKVRFDSIGFGEKDTEAFMLKEDGPRAEWIPFICVVDVFKNGLLLWHNREFDNFDYEEG